MLQHPAVLLPGELGFLVRWQALSFPAPRYCSSDNCNVTPAAGGDVQNTRYVAVAVRGAVGFYKNPTEAWEKLFLGRVLALAVCFICAVRGLLQLSLAC